MLLSWSDPAYATGGDILAGATHTGQTSSGFTPTGCPALAGNAFDGDDSTFSACTDSGGNPSTKATFNVNYPAVKYIRLKGSITGSTFNNFLVQITVGTTCVWQSRTGGCQTNGGGGWVGGTTYDTGIVDIGTARSTLDGASQQSITLGIFTVGAGGAPVLNVYQWEAYETLDVGPELYCSNARVDHPPFAWVVSCKWSNDWTGTLGISTDPSGSFTTNVAGDAGNTHSGSVSYNPAGGWHRSADGQAGITVTQNCYPLCQSDHITLDFDGDLGHSSLTFDRSEDGLIQDESIRPVITYIAACYDVTTNGCAGIGNWSNGAVGDVHVRYTWTGSDSQVVIGPEDISTGQEPPDSLVHNWYASVTPESAGTYERIMTQDIATDPELYTVYIFNGAGSRYLSAIIDRGTQSQTQTQPPSSPRDCDLIDVGCILRQLFESSADAVVDLVAGGVDELRELALSRQPFGYIVRAYDGMSTQVTRALDEVSDEDDCPGLSLQLPELPEISFTFLGKSYAGETWPSALTRPTFTFLTCEQLEPIFGTTEWQSIRTALDPALWLSFGFMWLRRLQPRPSVNG